MDRHAPCVAATQYSFLTALVLPLVLVVARVAPEASIAAAHGRTNEQHWLREKEREIAEKSKNK